MHNPRIEMPDLEPPPERPWGPGAIFTVLALLAASLCIFHACQDDPAVQAKRRDTRQNSTVPVAVQKVVQKNMPLSLRAIATVEASASVAVKSQVEGELTAVHFKEGGEVKAGDPLFTIDAKAYAAQLKQAEAALTRDRAQLENARKQAARYAGLVGEGGVAREQYDTLLTSVATLAAAVQAGEAAVESARIKVGYCTIRSPIDGVTGSLKIDRGNILKANDTETLVSIHQIRPIEVAFSLPERHLPVVRRRMGEARLEVRAMIPGEKDASETGVLNFIENAVDPTTGSIFLRASFENRQGRFWPGQFVHTELTLATAPGATVVPAQAVQTGQKGDFLFVVRADQTVEVRQIEVDRIVDGEAVIASGVAPDETVVIDGQLRLVAGARVKVAAPEPDAPNPSPQGEKQRP